MRQCYLKGGAVSPYPVISQGPDPKGGVIDISWPSFCIILPSGFEGKEDIKYKGAEGRES
jgi:hypothetical protein